MQSSKSAKLTFLLAFVAMGAFILTSAFSERRPLEGDRHSDARYVIEFEMRGELADLGADYVAVQDTLGKWMTDALIDVPLDHSEWELHSYLGEQNSQLFQWYTRLEFPSIAAGEAFLEEWKNADHLQLAVLGQEADVQVGTLKGSLEVPGDEECVISLDRIPFNLRTGMI